MSNHEGIPYKTRVINVKIAQQAGTETISTAVTINARYQTTTTCADINIEAPLTENTDPGDTTKTLSTQKVICVRERPLRLLFP